MSEEDKKLRKAALDEIPEADKPFYLAIAVTAVLIIVMGIGAIGALEGKVLLVELAEDWFVPVFGLMSMAWGFYFKGKA